jgi:hypothetical protein
MWWAYFLGVVLLLHPNACPLLEPICDSFDIRVLVKCQGAEPVAGHTALVEYDGVVPILGISPDQYCHLLAAPPTVETAIVIASEFAYYVGRVFVVAVFVAALFAEPGRVDFIRDCIRDVLIKRRKHKGGLSLSLRLGRFLPRHFR